METEEEINGIILAITIEIQAKHPELAKRLQELPVRISNENSPEINRKVLADYYVSLKSILKKYD